MALAIAVVTFAACSSSDDDKYVADVSLPAGTEKTSDADILVKAGAHEFTFDIKTEGKWTVTSQNRFLRVQNAEGTGNGTVTVAVQNNRSDDRKLGTLLITFPGHESENKTITVEQKYLGDYGGNAGVIKTGNQVYAVGYSYDATASYANPDAVKVEIFDTQALLDDKVLAVNAFQGSLRENTVTGSSVSEISNKLSAKASVEGSYCGFKGEVKASFDMEHFKSSNYEYALSYLDMTIRKASLSKSFKSVKFKYMTEDAYNDINGVPMVKKNGNVRISYKSNDEGFKDLIRDYGTHVIVRSGLGGRIRRSMEVDLTKVSSSYDVKAYVKASYEGAVDASAEVDEHYKESYKESKEAVNLNIDVLGGSDQMSKNLMSREGFTKENLQNWKNSVKEENMERRKYGPGQFR